MGVTGGHRPEPGVPAAPEQPQEHRFRLVVEGVTGHRAGGQHLSACSSGSGLEVGPWPDDDAVDDDAADDGPAEVDVFLALTVLDEAPEDDVEFADETLPDDEVTAGG